MAGLTRYEQEVIINFNAADSTAELYSANPVWIRKMDRLVEQNPEQFKLVEVIRCGGEVVAKRYSLPKRFLSVRSKDVVRELTEEQKAESAERLKKSREERAARKAE